MAEIDRSRVESFSSVYVLDSHYQYKDVGAVNIFNSPAGRELVTSNQSPERRKCTSNQKNSCTGKRPQHDVTKFVLNPGNLLINDVRSNLNLQTNYSSYDSLTSINASPLEANIISHDIRNSEEINSIQFMNEMESANKATNLEFNMETDESIGGITRRLLNDNSNQHKRPQLDKSQSLTDDRIDKQLDSDDLEMKIDKKILRYNSNREIIKQNNFSGEKCDIFRKLLSGFLSGWSTGSLSDITRWRKRKSSDELYREASLALGIPCELTDSCRCIECQCHYFDCGDEDSESSEISMNMYDSDIEEWSQEQTFNNHYSDVVFFENETNHETPQYQDHLDKDTSVEIADISFGDERDHSSESSVDSPDIKENQNIPINDSTKLDDETGPTLEIAAGTPVILDHLLNNPVSCSLQ